jgi:hypothetical protein
MSKVNQAVKISGGYLHKRDPNYGSLVRCYVCGRKHNARHLARIQDGEATSDVPLCKRCHDAERSDAIVRKYWQAPDLTIEEGGEASAEQIQALVDRAGETEH